MKYLLCLLALATAAIAVPPTPGDAVKTAAFAKTEFLQGDAPAKWESQALYVIACWSSWSQQSLVELPRLSQLYADRKPDGLRVIGVNVWDDDPAVVGHLLSEKSTAMAFPVAYVGMTGDFIDQWLGQTGPKSLPHAFVVKDGVLLFACHPSLLTDETVGMLLEDGPQAAAFVKKQRDAAARAARVATLDGRLSQLARANKHQDALVLITKELANPEGLTTEDRQRFTITKAAIQVALKQKDAALKSLDEAKALDPQSKMAGEIGSLKERITEQVK